MIQIEPRKYQREALDAIAKVMASTSTHLPADGDRQNYRVRNADRGAGRTLPDYRE